MPAAPRDLEVGADREQEIELLGEQLIVIVKVITEQRKGLDERAAPGHDLRPAAGEKVEGGELLIDAHRIVRRQHGHRARQANALGARGRGGERDRGRRHRVIRPMMLAEAEHVETDPIGAFGLLHDVSEALVDVDRLARPRIAPGLDKSVDAKLHRGLESACFPVGGQAMLAWRRAWI